MAALTAALVGATLAGAYTQSQAQQAQGDYQKKMYDINAGLDDMRSKDAIARGDAASSNYGKQVAGMVGSQRAEFASQGVDVGSGSAAQVQSDTSQIGAKDMMTMRNNAWREAWGYQTQELNDRMQGRFAEESGEVNSRNTLLTGGLKAIGYGYSEFGGSSKSSKSKTSSEDVSQ